MHKFILASVLCLSVFDATAEQTYRFRDLSDAIVFARFKNEADGYNDRNPNTNHEPRHTAEQYVIDGIKVIVSNDYARHVSEKAVLQGKTIDRAKLAYIDECVSLTQNIKMCNDLWEERQK
jgi:hypothetical protein